MMISKRTAKCAKLMAFFKILSILCFIVPLTVFAGIALAENILITETFTLAAAVLVTLIITLVCAINKTVMRSKIWVIILALFFTIEHFLPILLTVAITQIADELIFTPLSNHFRAMYLANKEIDRRV